MEIREALRVHSPSLLLQRAAADEIAKLDRLAFQLRSHLQVAYERQDHLKTRIAELESQLADMQQEKSL